MAAVDDNPTMTLPGRLVVPRAESNGLTAVPCEVEVEETGKLSTSLYEAVQGDQAVTPENFLEQLAGKISELSAGDGGGGGDAPEKHAKSIKRHNWITVIMALLLGPGGIVTAMYVMDGRSKSNEKEVQVLRAADAIQKPKVDKNTEDIQQLKSDVKGINESVGEMKGQQTTIVEGITALKQEKVDKLEADLARAERELRRRDRLDNGR